MSHDTTAEDERWFMNQPESFRAALNKDVNEEWAAAGPAAGRAPIQLKHIRRARAVAETLAHVRPEQRADFMGLIKILFCGECWRELDEGERCHCSNDE